MPKPSSADAATAAARDLIYALQNPHPAAPIAPLADDHRKGLQNLADISQQDTTHPKPAPRVRFADNQPNLPITARSPRVPPSGTAFTYAAKYDESLRAITSNQLYSRQSQYSLTTDLRHLWMILPPMSLDQCNLPVAPLTRLLDAAQKSQRSQHPNRAQ